MVSWYNSLSYLLVGYPTQIHPATSLEHVITWPGLKTGQPTWDPKELPNMCRHIYIYLHTHDIYIYTHTFYRYTSFKGRASVVSFESGICTWMFAVLVLVDKYNGTTPRMIGVYAQHILCGASHLANGLWLSYYTPGIDGISLYIIYIYAYINP